MEDKKVIWITGASSGIGRALAIKFANENWIVAASARRENFIDIYVCFFDVYLSFCFWIASWDNGNTISGY